MASEELSKKASTTEFITFESLPKAVQELSKKIDNLENLIKNSNQNQPEQEQFLNIEQAASFLNLSVPTLYGYVSKQEINVCKRKKRLYFAKNDLISYLEQGKKRTIAEIEAEPDSLIIKKRKVGI